MNIWDSFDWSIWEKNKKLQDEVLNLKWAIMRKDSEHRKSASIMKERVKIMKMKESSSQERVVNQKWAYESVINALRRNNESKHKWR